MLGGFVHAHHAEAVHHGFDRLRRIDFGDDDLSAQTARAAGQSAATPAVAGDDELRARQQEVGGANDAVDGGLSGAVAVVEQVLGVGVVDRDDGIAQHALLRHGAQADDAGGGLFGAGNHAIEHVGALGERDGDQVGAVIHGDVRLVIERRHDVRVVGIVVLALDGVDRDVVVAHQAGGDIVLRGQRIGGAQHNIGAAIAQGDGQVGGFSRHVQAGRNAHALQRLVLDEVLADDLQDLHGLVGPVNALLAHIGKCEVGDIAGGASGCG